jgi:hypothetical protein
MFEYMQTDLREGRQVLMDGSKLLGLLDSGGFTNIVNKTIKIPISTWSAGSPI